MVSIVGFPKMTRSRSAELERLRRSGARFIVFGWPAFWWLAHYRKFHDYLRARFNIILRNERLVVFDLAGGD